MRPFMARKLLKKVLSLSALPKGYWSVLVWKMLDFRERLNLRHVVNESFSTVLPAALSSLLVFRPEKVNTGRAPLTVVIVEVSVAEDVPVDAVATRISDPGANSSASLDPTRVVSSPSRSAMVPALTTGEASKTKLKARWNPPSPKRLLRWKVRLPKLKPVKSSE